jgi:hypothetical protein
MGNNPSIPSLDFHFKSSCCNGADMDQSERPCRVRGSFQAFKESIRYKKRDSKLIEHAAGVQPKQTDEETIPHKSL